MNLDFIYRLQEYTETLNLFAPSVIGVLDYDDSISIITQAGGIKTLFYDGQRDQTYNIQYTAKSKNQEVCIESLQTIMNALISVTDLPSQNDSYVFVEINIESPPSYVGQDEQNYFVWQLSATARMIIRKGVL